MKWLTWSGIAFLYKKLPYDMLNSQLKKVLADPGVAAKLNSLTLEPMHMTPDEFAQRLKADYERYGKLITAAATKAN